MRRLLREELLCGGRDVLLRILTINSAGDSAVKLRWGWITVAGDIESVEG